MGGRACTIHSKNYTITEYDSQPKPLQRPHPPIFIGGGGKRLLSFAAREADIVGIIARAKPGGGLNAAEETDACIAVKVDHVQREACERFDQIELAALIQAVAVTDNRHHAAEAIAARGSRPTEQILTSPYHLIGTSNKSSTR